MQMWTVTNMVINILYENHRMVCDEPLLLLQCDDHYLARKIDV